jgi:hypothetical protein
MAAWAARNAADQRSLRQRFQPNSLEVARFFSTANNASGSLATLYFPNDLACVIHNADARLLE